MRSKGEGSISQCRNGRWLGQISIGHVNGKRLRRSVTARTRSECVRALQELRERNQHPNLSRAPSGIIYYCKIREGLRFRRSTGTTDWDEALRGCPAV